MRRYVTVITLLLCMLVSLSHGQDAVKTAHLYVIGLNGSPVTVDGELGDWKDAQFIYLSQDGPNHQFYPGEIPTASPADLSEHVAIKMDNANIYFAANVRDEGGVLIHNRRIVSNANAMWMDDHFAVYLGLYNIGNLPGSPHKNTVDIIDPATGTILQSGRTYRVKPGTDNDPDGATLGPDYQIGVHIQDYDNTLTNGAYYASGSQVLNYNWGYVDTLIANTELAIRVWEDEKGYTLEWKIPFASLAGKITKKAAPQSVLEWPLYMPKDGDVIPFDFDLTDEDRPNQAGSNFLRYGPNGNLWRESFGFGGRALIKDMTKITRSNFYHVQLAQNANVKLDGELTEWANIQFIGISQDSPNSGFYAGAVPTSSPADFSGYIAMRMDNDHVYFAAKIRDEGGVLIHDRRTTSNAGAMWQDDHFAAYLSLFDIGELPASPHIKVVDIIDPATGTILQSGRTYRVKPGTDNDPDGKTLGADYQIGVHIQDYDLTLINGAYHASEDEVLNYNWGYVDTLIANTELAIKVWSNEKGYDLEWKVPFASLAGKIARPSKPQSILEWPLYSPQEGDVIPFDIDITDEDRPNQTGSTFLRFGPNGSLWRDSFNFGLRGIVMATNGTFSVVENKSIDDYIPESFSLMQNYPNPFNPSTTIRFDVDKTSHVTLKVYDVLGRNIATLVNSTLNPGFYQVTWKAEIGLTSGLYIYRLERDDQVQVRKMLLMK